MMGGDQVFQLALWLLGSLLLFTVASVLVRRPLLRFVQSGWAAYLVDPANRNLVASMNGGTEAAGYEPEAELEPELDASYPAPLSYAQRMALTAKRARRKPRVFDSGPYVADGGAVREDGSTILSTLTESVDDRWVLFSNLLLPGERSPIDVVMVGPGGIVALDVSSSVSHWHEENGVWFRQGSDGGWESQEQGPGGQVVYQAARLHDYLMEKSIQRKNDVRPVVLVQAEQQAENVLPEAEIWLLNELEAQFVVLNKAEALSPFRVNRVVEKLEQVIVDRMAAAT